MTKKKQERQSLLAGASIVAAAMAMLGAAQPAAAQTTPTAEDADDEEIVVVGSRIRRDNFNTDAPVQVITQEENTLAGLISSTEALQSNAVTSGGYQIDNLYGGLVSNGGPGANTLGLRGFGPTSTLILLNGRRLTPAGTRGAVGAADLNTIPSALVDRIEILKDGASSIYGSDAVAGVVNIITNQNLDGFVLEGQQNFVEAGGSDQIRLSLSGGGELGNLSLVGSIEYYERAAQTFGQREWSRCPGDGLRDPATGEPIVETDPLTGGQECWSINGANGAGVTVNTIGTAARAGVPGPGAAGGAFTRWRPNSAIGNGPGGILDGFEGVNGGGFGFANRDTFDPRMLDQDIFSPANTLNIFLQGTYHLDGADEVYAEVLHSTRESTATNFIQFTIDYPNNALLPAELRTGGAALPPQMTLPLPTNYPMPADYPVQVRAFTALGNLTQHTEVEYDRFTGGIRGDIDAFEGWNYDFNISYGRNHGENTTRNFRRDRLYNSLVIAPAVGGEPANQVHNIGGTNYVCQITLTNPAYGCIPAPALSTEVIAGRNWPNDWFDWTYVPLTEINIYEESSMSLVVDGPLFRLPAGAVQSAFGMEFRRGEINNTPSAEAQDNNVYNYSSGGPTRGTDSVREAFGELEVPILDGAPFADSLAINLSGRYTDYDSYGADTTYKIGITWSPIEDLMFRATRGNSYRAPALFEQFLGPSTGFTAASNDPCDDYGSLPPTDQVFINCNAEIGNTAFVQTSSVTVFHGGGAAVGLFAETSDNYTAGFTWHALHDPASWGDLSLAVDQFSIDLHDSINRIGENNIMNQCYGSPDPSTQPLCSLVSRDSVGRLTVFDFYTNIAQQTAVGWDYSLRYIKDLFGGEFVADLNVTQFTEQTTQPLPAFDPEDLNGAILSPEVNADLTINYERGPWTLHYGMNFVQGMDDYVQEGEDRATSIHDLDTPDYYLHDLSVQYRADAWQLTAGVRNLFDEQPDAVSVFDDRINGNGATPIFSGFDYFGRQFFVNLSARF